MKKKRFLFLCAIFAIPYCFLRISVNYHLSAADENFNNVHYCPACYGDSLCPQFYHGEVELLGVSRLKYFQFVNRKNVFDAKLNGNRVVLKKLAHDWEFVESDEQLCDRANLDKGCDVRFAVKLLCLKIHGSRQVNLKNILRAFGSTTDLSLCPSERLLRYLMDRFSSEHSLSSVHILNKTAQFMYTILMNPEPVILQGFPQNEGWPFPLYRGSCGRMIAEEFIGKTLSYYQDSPWEQRLDLAYQLLQLAHQLTDNFSGFALYMTDVNMDNFAVRSDGTVFLIDVENIIIVDRKEIARKRQPNWDKLHTSKGDACKDCLSFSVEDLCSYNMSDHNYYAICRGILVPGSYYSNKGLLHSMPPMLDRVTDLSNLVKECAFPRTKPDRFSIMPKILQTMKTLL